MQICPRSDTRMPSTLCSHQQNLRVTLFIEYAVMHPARLHIPRCDVSASRLPPHTHIPTLCQNVAPETTRVVDPVLLPVPL